MGKLEENVKGLVTEQLRACGFDPDLMAADLNSIRDLSQAQQSRLYAAAAATCQPDNTLSGAQSVLSREERQEDRFWTCRRALRLWPLPGGTRSSLEEYLTTKLRMEERFVREELGRTEIIPNKNPRAKIGNEATVYFESKDVRDYVKSQAHNLAEHGGAVGMRLEIPHHLQKDFRVLMKLLYVLKKKHTQLKRNVKFDEDSLGFFMDIQLRENGNWSRIKPYQARAALANEPQASTGGEPAEMEAGDIVDLLVSSNEDDDE